eukprot:TRINITY_DN58564_c0_g1_i1.p1 TRINITY_DN58564_c0_g1~~TRINITY_DN58564_c0_g1_i1.p1  ORF type:complete len:916 (+),score=55.65 TRINITY_DN58564_c0_g1_i1:45-2792(+)
MELLQRDINCLGDKSDLGKRRQSLQRIKKALANASKQPEKGPDDEECESEHLQICKAVYRPVLKLFSDSSESVRESAVDTIVSCMGVLDETCLNPVVEQIAFRIGMEKEGGRGLLEPSEDVRLQLLELATKVLRTYPHDIAAANLIDWYKEIIIHCLRDPMPELKKEASATIKELCSAVPSQVKYISKNLVEPVRANFKHKHGQVRLQMVKAFSRLIMHGAAEVLEDTRDFTETQTTLYALGIVINDQNESVRLTLLKSFSKWLTRLVGRLDHHHRLMPFVLLCLTDASSQVSTRARQLMDELGRLYAKDNENNDPHVEHRHITYKDIEWYADEFYPDMTMESPTNIPQPYGAREHRPDVCSRMVVTECVRRWLPDVLKKIIDPDWSVPFSHMKQRTVAVRMLQSTLRYVESNIVQYLQEVLDCLYKTVYDDDKHIAKEILYTSELLGKFTEPKHYIPLILADQRKRDADGNPITDDGVVVVTTDEDKKKEPSTWYSVCTPKIRASLVTVFCQLLKGAKETITLSQVDAIVEAVGKEEFIDLDRELLLNSIINLLQTVMVLCTEQGRNWLSTSGDDPEHARQLQFGLLCCFLRMTATEIAAIPPRAEESIQLLAKHSNQTIQDLYKTHFGTALNSPLLSPPVLRNLLETASADTHAEHRDKIVHLFVKLLSEIDYDVDTSNNLEYFLHLNSYLDSSNGAGLTDEQIEMLLRLVLIPHCSWNVSRASQQFRRIAMGCISIFVARNRLLPLFPKMGDLMKTTIDVVQSSYDTDDAAVRAVAVTMTPSLLKWPIEAGQCNEIMKEFLKCYNDQKDSVRIGTAKALKRIYTEMESASDRVKDLMVPTPQFGTSQLVEEVVKLSLIHMDDPNEDLKEAICSALVTMANRAPSLKEVVQTKTKAVKSKHSVPTYCDQILTC